MKPIRSRIDKLGLTTVPAEVRAMLKIGPGSVLEWGTSKSEILVRKVRPFTSLDAHAALFPDGAPKRVAAMVTPASTKSNIRKSTRKRFLPD
jgi:bifunctional DNA-binding transcriptional regulator/antitoxin component of YhaV-PrlF toxin-antitoxin module